MTVRGWIVAIGFGLAAIAAIGFGAYHAGRVSAVADALANARQDSVKHIGEQLRSNADTLGIERRATAAAVTKDSAARIVRTRARAKVRIVGDSQLVIVAPKDSAGVVVDSVGPKIDTPKEVIAEIRSSDALILQDSVTIALQAAELQTLYRRDSLHTERDRLLQAQLDATKPQRCGRRCGFIAGVTAVVAVTHPAQLMKATEWIIHRVH